MERRFVDFVVRRVDHMKVVKLLEENEGLEKTISETIEKDLEINELDRDMVYDTTL